jgi:caffeoyl-CoA O-methyltransferase
MIKTDIQDYANRFTSRQTELLQELLQKTYDERADKNMLSGFYQGRVLSMISHLVSPRRILEIGTYVGFSALCLAEGLTSDGRIITLDVEPETNAVARDFFGRSEFVGRIDARLGFAAEIIPTLDETFDLVFIDADKPNYSAYFDLIFPKLRIGGLIVADNVLWSGAVLEVENGEQSDENSVALHEFNQKVSADERVSNILLTIRDGLMIVRKEKD